MSLLPLGTIRNVEIIPSPIQFRVNFVSRFLRGLEDGEIKTNPEYALVTVDAATGTFGCQSGFGNFSSQWHPSRLDCDIFTFLASLDFEYFMEKASNGPWRIFDRAKTIEQIREQIRMERRGKRSWADLTAEKANQLWAALDAIEKEQPDTEDRFFQSWYRHSVLAEWHLDYPPAIYTKIAPLAQSFWDQIFTPLVNSIQFRSFMKVAQAA